MSLPCCAGASGSNRRCVLEASFRPMAVKDAGNLEVWLFFVFLYVRKDYWLFGLMIVVRCSVRGLKRFLKFFHQCGLFDIALIVYNSLTQFILGYVKQVSTTAGLFCLQGAAH